MKTGLLLVAIGIATLGVDLLLDFVVFEEEKCTVVDWLLVRDARGIVECSTFPFIKARVMGYLALGMGVLGIVGSAALAMVHRSGT